VVVSSVTPLMRARLARIPGRIDLASLALIAANRMVSSSEARLGQHRQVLLGLGAEMQQQRGVAAVVEDHVRVADIVRPFEDAVGVVPVIDQRFALEANTGMPVGGDGGRCVILGREDVARGPADFGTERGRVSISTAVWMVMCSEPVMRAPLSGCSSANSSRSAIRPGISVSAMRISLRPQSARLMSAMT
jgi:hypothetical protein